jgi:class 3 adenylate cyclase
MLDRDDYDLLLLDIMMPGLNGYQVLERVKGAERTRHIPVIMVTALEEIDSTVLCIKMGAEDYLPKPFNPTLLKARVEASLEKKRLRDREVLHLRQIEEQKSRVDGLLHVILPDAIVDELTRTNAVRPRRFEDVAVMFTDIVGFTPYCERHEPEEIVANLQQLVEAQEAAAVRHGLQKIKTIGDSFMATAGAIRPLENPVLNAVQCGLDMVHTSRELPAHWEVRCGIHVGPVMAGIVGHRQYLFDLWGDTVNTAARVEGNGVPGAVNLSGPAWNAVAARCRGESRGLISLKGLGEMEVFRVDSLRP